MQRSSNIPGLTGIRGIAAVWVLCFHAQLVCEEYFGFKMAWMPFGDGWSGVDLFFVLSGFILMHAHAADFQTLGGQQILRFARARFLRVYPVSFAVLLLIGTSLLVPGFADWYRSLNPGNFSFAAFAQTAALATRWFLPPVGDFNQPTWSLSVEILGYAAFPLIALVLNRIRWSFFHAAIVGLALLALLGAQFVRGTLLINDIGQNGAFARMICCFVAGAAASRIPISNDRFAALLAWFCLTLIVAGGLIEAALPLRPALFTGLIAALAQRHGLLSELMSSRPIVYLGKISFPLYLIHVTPLLLVVHLTSAQSPTAKTGALLLAIALSIAGAVAVHHLIERPVHEYGRRQARIKPS